MTSQAELITDKASDSERQSALQLLKKAADIFDRCYELQFAHLKGQEFAPEHTETASQSSGSEYSSSNAVAEEHWASLLEPLTYDTLTDTTIAQIEVYISICALHSWLSASDLDHIDSRAAQIFRNQDQLSAQVTSRHSETSLAKANFIAASLDASFRLNLLGINTYENGLKSAFATVLEPPLETPQARCDHADALLTFHATIVAASNEDERSRLAQLQWTLLSSALSSYQRALALPDVQNLAKIHMRRGDCELLRYRMAEPPLMYKAASASSTILLKNAATYYRGSAAAARIDNVEGGDTESNIKEAVASALVSGEKAGLPPGLMKTFRATLEEMGNEGILSGDTYRNLLA